MQISPARRRDACLHLIESGFDVDETVEWFLKTYADDPAVEAAKNPEKLARNIITMGGTGINQHVNMVAFQQALTQYQDERLRRAQSVADSEITSLREQVERERDRVNETQRQYNEQVRKVEALNEELAQSQRTLYQLKAPNDAEPATVS